MPPTTLKMIRIAAAQIPISDDIAENLQTILKNIRIAAKKGADIICFPEICLVCDEKKVRAIGKETKAICRAAAKIGIHVIFGTYVKEEEKIKNQIWVVDKNGKVVHKYSKRHAYISERPFLKEGKKNKVITLDGVPIAVINCWDYAYPEHIRKLALQGAKIIFCPSYLLSHPKTKDVLDKIPQVRAFDSMSYFVMVDAYDEETFQKSKICHPLRELASIKKKAGIIYAHADLAEIDDLRSLFLNLR